jgi:hypothetical protein
MFHAKKVTKFFRFDVNFETNFGYESGDHVGSFDERSEVKNLMQVYNTFNSA